MHAHRSVGQVTFVTGDMVLGAPETASEVEQLLDDLEPETLAVDVSIEDLNAIQSSSDIQDPFLTAHVAAVEEDAEVEILEPYERIMAWAKDRDLELQPLASRSSVGLVKARRIKRTAKKTEAEGFEARAQAAVDALLADAQVEPLTKRRRTSLAETLTSLLRREPPRTVALFMYPWGEMVSEDVRRTLGLRRTEGEQMAGGWPD